jgi:hypothetical protein
VVALGPVLQSTANIISNEYIADVVVALAARPRATAYGVIYEDDGDGTSTSAPVATARPRITPRCRTRSRRSSFSAA